MVCFTELEIQQLPVFDTVAKSNGYSDKFELFGDYGFIPTVLMPKHRKFEIVKLLYRHIRKH